MISLLKKISNREFGTDSVCIALANEANKDNGVQTCAMEILGENLIFLPAYSCSF